MLMLHFLTAQKQAGLEGEEAGTTSKAGEANREVSGTRHSVGGVTVSLENLGGRGTASGQMAHAHAAHHDFFSSISS